jgi:hypothetical protein
MSFDPAEMYRGLNGYDGSYYDPAMLGLGGLNAASVDAMIADGTIGLYTDSSEQLFEAAANAEVGSTIPAANEKPILVTEDLHNAGIAYLAAIEDGRLTKPNTGFGLSDLVFAGTTILGPLGVGGELLNTFAPNVASFIDNAGQQVSDFFAGVFDGLSPFEAAEDLYASGVDTIGGIEEALFESGLVDEGFSLPLDRSFIEGIESGSGLIANSFGELGITPSSYGVINEFTRQYFNENPISYVDWNAPAGGFTKQYFSDLSNLVDQGGSIGNAINQLDPIGSIYREHGLEVPEGLGPQSPNVLDPIRDLYDEYGLNPPGNSEPNLGDIEANSPTGESPFPDLGELIDVIPVPEVTPPQVTPPPVTTTPPPLNIPYSGLSSPGNASGVLSQARDLYSNRYGLPGGKLDRNQPTTPVLPPMDDIEAA